MLPSQNRLNRKKDFDLVFKNSKSQKNGFLLFRAVKNSLPEARFGFVVSKKVSPKATVRNLVKRRLRKAVENVLKDVKKPFDVVVITLPGIEKKEFTEIQTAITQSFKKLQIT